MIHISLKLHDEKIQSMQISGHAGYADKGKDLICAAVSAISFGLCNALDQMKSDCNIDLKDNFIEIQVNHDSLETQTILKTALIQFETVEEISSQYIEIQKTEV